jgi:ribosome-associated protein
VAEPIVIGAGVVVPASALMVRATRSSGPGGQNVNKVASRVELRVDLDRVEGLAEDARARLLVTSQRTRDQHRNLEDARAKVRALLQRALIPPKRRRPTRVTAAARAARLARKRQRSETKRARGAVGTED